MTYSPIPDSMDFKINTTVYSLAYMTHLLEKEGKNVLIHCSAGQSRSVSVILVYSMKYKKMSLKDSFNHIKKICESAGPNVGFMKQLTEIEKEIFSIASSSFDLNNYMIDALFELFKGSGKVNKEMCQKVLEKCNFDIKIAQNVLFPIAYGN